jgi:alpha-tubulin suppressor-like RCC1 family protein
VDQVLIVHQADRIFWMSGHNLTAIINHAGELYVCGKNEDGQLGIKETEESIPYLTRVPMQEQIVSVGTGLRHTILVDSTGVLWASGGNEKGQQYFISKRTTK